MEELLTTQEVADYFKVDCRTVTQKFIKEGLKYFPIGKRDYRYDKRDVLEFKENKKEDSQFNDIYTAAHKVKRRRINSEKQRINIQELRIV